MSRETWPAARARPMSWLRLLACSNAGRALREQQPAFAAGRNL